MSDIQELLVSKKYPLDLFIVLIFSIIGVIMAYALPDGNLIRIIFGIPLLLFFPGYALVSMLWPGKEIISTTSENSEEEIDKTNKRFIDNLERIALSFGLSIAIVSLMGLALNYTSSGITLESSIISNLVLVMIFVGLAYFRRSKLPMEEKFHIDFSFKSYKFPTDKTEIMFILVIAICLIASVITLGYALTTPSPEQQYTEFYILDANGTAENYPLNMTLNGTASIVVGIVCHEYEITDYTILIGLDGANISEDYYDWSIPYDLNNDSLARRTIVLDQQEVFQETFNFQIKEPGRHMIVWQLMINGEITDYEVHFWMDVNAAY
jgi:uncharacterized membrane protein